MQVVVDSNVIIHGRRGDSFNEAFTIPEIFNEMKSKEAKRKADSMNLKVEKPDEEAVKKVEKQSRQINSPTSDIDDKLAALALKKNLTLLTDDKALQNLAELLNIDYSSFMDSEIEKTLKWKLECHNCGNEINKSPCHLCGSDEIERKSLPYS